MYYVESTDYVNLFNSIADRLCTNANSADRPILNSFNIYNDLIMYEPRFKEFSNCYANAFNINIAGTEISQIIIIEYMGDKTLTGNINGVYRIKNKLYYVAILNTKIIYSISAKSDDLAAFYDECSGIITNIFGYDPYIRFSFSQCLRFYAIFTILYKTFKPDKKFFIDFMEHYKMKWPPITGGSKVYENLVALVSNRAATLTDAKIVKAIMDGVNDVQSDNILQTRFVPGVQEKSSD